LQVTPTDSVIDLGAGTGYYTLPLAQTATRNVYALDKDQQMLTYLKTKAEKAGIENITYLNSSLATIPLENEQIDKAMASLVLHEVSSIDEALKEIHRVLKKEGEFLCIELEDTAKQSHHHPRITANELEKALEKNGFTLVEKREPSATTYVLLAKKIAD